MAAYPRELTTHLPEHSFLDPAFWNERARGLGATIAVPLGSSAEENVLCDGADRYRGEDITVHEFAHSLHLLGLSQVHSTFNPELKQLYAVARASGAWGAGHYAMTDYKEYFAEGVQSYFDANMADPRAPVTRAQLRRRDPGLYSLLLRYLAVLYCNSLYCTVLVTTMVNGCTILYLRCIVVKFATTQVPWG